MKRLWHRLWHRHLYLYEGGRHERTPEQVEFGFVGGFGTEWWPYLQLTSDSVSLPFLVWKRCRECDHVEYVIALQGGRDE